MNTDHRAASTRIDGTHIDTPPGAGCCHPEADCPDHAQPTIALTLTEVADLVELLDEIDEFLRLGHHSIDALTDFYRTHHDDNHPRFVALCLLDSVSLTALSLRGRARAASNHPATYSGADPRAVIGSGRRDACRVAVRRSSYRNRPDLLVMPVIFQDISTSRGGCLSMELEASRCLCLTHA